MFRCYTCQQNQKSFFEAGSLEQLNSTEVGVNKPHFTGEESDPSLAQVTQLESGGIRQLGSRVDPIKNGYFPVRKENGNIIKFIFLFFAV